MPVVGCDLAGIKSINYLVSVGLSRSEYLVVSSFGISGKLVDSGERAIEFIVSAS